MPNTQSVRKGHLCVMIGLMWSAVATAQDSGMNSWGVSFDNDQWGHGTDSHYTHGTRFFVRSDRTSGWLQRIAGVLPCHACADPTEVEYEFGQEIYTPFHTFWPDLIKGDRPYAGWLYAKASLLREQATSNPRLQRFSRIGFQVGVIGPASLAEQAQKWIHEIQKIDLPRGWDHQIGNEPGLVLSYKRGVRYRLSRDTGDAITHRISPYVVGAVGNVSTYLGIGTEFQSSLAPRNQRRPADAAWRLFLNIEARAVIRNIFLDGNSWSSSHSVEKIPLVADATVGLQYQGRRFGVRLARNIRSPEFDGQPRSNTYGTLSFWVGSQRY